MDFTKKVAIITGGARGIGQACARRFANDGASVVITDVIDEEGRDLAASIRDDGAAALFEHHDVSNEASWQTVVAKAVSELGGVHVLVNNAGIGTVRGRRARDRGGLGQADAINQRGVWLGMKHVGPASSGGRRFDRQHELHLRRRRRVREARSRSTRPRGPSGS